MEKEKFYLTKEGLERVKKEKQGLQEIKALKARGEVPDFLHSEEVNPDYLSFREDIGFLEARLAELENILRNIELIQPPSKEEQDKVYLGATVLAEVDGRLDEFTIVGSLEANPSVGKISNQSPVGKALLGKKVGETVFISSPIKVGYKIKQIKYDL
jgi:transcription elongation factor GreA